MSEHFLEELNSATGFWSKLRLTLLLLIFGTLLGPFLLLGVMATQDPFWRPVIRIGVETIVVFYVTLLVYVWWRPPFLRSFYRVLELKLVVLGYLLNFSMLALMLVGAVYGLVSFFRGP
jgi:hypothetical protein